MRLGIISDCTHYATSSGKVGTENHILLRQLQALSSYFTDTIICCPFQTLDAQKVITLYSDERIKFVQLPVVGGDTIKDKLQIFRTFPSWYKGYRKVDKSSDIVYQRFPNNLNIPGFFFFFFKQKKVFATYTGTWSNYASEPTTFRFQKWLLKKYFKGPVWVYVDKEKLSSRIFGGFSPSYSKAEWDEETQQVNLRIQKLKIEGLKVFRVITVGTLIDYKNQLTILKACLILKKRNFTFHLSVVGDGPMLQELNTFIKDNDLNEDVMLLGKKDHLKLRQLYREHDFVVQAPLSEGFGKVPIEGFFHGVIPVINNISLAAYITGNGDRGFLFNASNAENLANCLQEIKEKVYELPQMIEKGRAFAQSQTLEVWAEEYYKKVTSYFAAT